MRSSRRRDRSGQFVIGVDFGTLSGRALLVNVDDGEEVASAVHEYSDGVITDHLPGGGKRLPPETALQNPADYLEVLKKTVPAVLRASGVRPEQVIGIGTDFTSCTVLPVDGGGRPLCLSARWRKNPHAWVKLWKHHAAQREADFINEVGGKRGERFLRVYGGRYSSEWFFSKVLETLRSAPAVYEAADRFIEAGDWIVWQLCGAERRNVSGAGFKAMWVYPTAKGDDRKSAEQLVSGPLRGWNYPQGDFFRALDPRMAHVVEEKLSADIYPLGSCAGGLTDEMGVVTGLRPGIPVAVGNIDAHVAVPACTVTGPGKLVMILGTSTCHLVLSDCYQEIEGICGVVKDGIIPGLWGYEAGQAGVGDLFAWFVDRAVPAEVQARAKRLGRSVHDLLQEQASKLRPGESGLVALDWWNGNRSVLMDADLSGLLVGATLATKPHEIYRALIEATAFGTRRIIEAFSEIEISELYACGGLAERSALLLQIYADVTGRPIRVAASKQTCALGAAMHAAVAAGAYPNIQAAAGKMARVDRKVYQPNGRAKPVYDQIYAVYLQLYEEFGRDPNGAMKVLRRLRNAALKTTVQSKR